MSKEKVILPPATIGILGGGQLGRMMAISARQMGYSIVTLDPTENCPCAQVADFQVIADYNSTQGAKELAKKSDVLTYEFENIGANIADYLQLESYLPQGYNLLYTTQNRLREKQAIEEAGAPVAPHRPVKTKEQLMLAVQELGLPIVLKTCEGGYDGKGQWVLRTQEDIDKLDIFSNNQLELVAEKFMPFSKELSVIVARNPRGDVQAFPVSENIHQNNILHLSIVPARVPEEVIEQADEIGKKLAKHFSLVGLLAIELFLLEDGSLVVNELAPRPHNSGHYTQEACQTSQFEQHIRAVCNLPLSEPKLHTPTVMVNILGKHLPRVYQLIPQLSPDCKVHLYGKKDPAPNRKMGHINVMADSTESALKIIEDMMLTRG